MLDRAHEEGKINKILHDEACHGLRLDSFEPELNDLQQGWLEKDMRADIAEGASWCCCRFGCISWTLLKQVACGVCWQLQSCW